MKVIWLIIQPCKIMIVHQKNRNRNWCFIMDLSILTAYLSAHFPWRIFSVFSSSSSDGTTLNSLSLLRWNPYPVHLFFLCHWKNDFIRPILTRNCYSSVTGAKCFGYKSFDMRHIQHNCFCYIASIGQTFYKD